MPLTQNCNICRKFLTDLEIKASDDVKLPRMCEKHLQEIKPKLEKCLKAFQNLKFS